MGQMYWQEQLKGKIPLHCSTSSGKENLLRFFVDSYAFTEAVCKNGQTALHIAAAFGHPHLVVDLTLCGTLNPDSVDKAGNTPLHLAAFHGHAEVVKKLKIIRVNPNATNKCGFAAIHLAARGNHINVIKSMANWAGAKFNIKCPALGVDDNSFLGIYTNPSRKSLLTALHIAAFFGHDDVVKTLVKDCKADINIQDSNGGEGSALCSERRAQ